MTENPVWVKIWKELEADFERRCRGDARPAGGGLTVVLELSPDTPDFEFVPRD